MFIVNVLAFGTSPGERDASEIVRDVLPVATAVMCTESLLMPAVATLELGGVVIEYGGVPPVNLVDDVPPALIVTELFGKLEVNVPPPPGGAVGSSSLLHPQTHTRKNAQTA
jgi:hypothetical protein